MKLMDMCRRNEDHNLEHHQCTSTTLAGFHLLASLAYLNFSIWSDVSFLLQVSPSPHGAHQQVQASPSSNAHLQVFKGMKEDEVFQLSSSHCYYLCLASCSSLTSNLVGPESLRCFEKWGSLLITL